MPIIQGNISYENFAKDAKHVYVNGALIENADPDNFDAELSYEELEGSKTQTYK